MSSLNLVGFLEPSGFHVQTTGRGFPGMRLTPSRDVRHTPRVLRRELCVASMVPQGREAAVSPPPRKFCQRAESVRGHASLLMKIREEPSDPGQCWEDVLPPPRLTLAWKGEPLIRWALSLQLAGPCPWCRGIPFPLKPLLGALPGEPGLFSPSSLSGCGRLL